MKGFKEFLLKHQVFGLAVGVIIGTAIGKVVTSLVADILMPVVSLFIPGGEWKTAKWVLTRTEGPDGKEVVNAINYGAFVGTVVDFVVIAICVYMIMKAFIKEAPAPSTKECPKCTEAVPLAAKRCKFCTADLA